MLAGFGDTNHIEVPPLGVVEHGVFEVGVWFIPILTFEEEADFSVFEDASMTSKDKAAHELQWM